MITEHNITIGLIDTTEQSRPTRHRCGAFGVVNFG